MELGLSGKFEKKKASTVSALVDVTGKINHY